MYGTDVIHGEYVALVVQGDDYESCVVQAMGRFVAFLGDGQRLVRTVGEAQDGDWYVAGTVGEVSLGGTTLQLTVAFRRHD